MFTRRGGLVAMALERSPEGPWIECRPKRRHFDGGEMLRLLYCVMPVHVKKTKGGRNFRSPLLRRLS